MTAKPATRSDSNVSFARRSETLLSVALLAVLVVLLIPLPTALLDMLLALNLGITVMLLLITLSARQPLDISVFPSLLLLMTLYRLSLNVATTRLILLNGDAGRIVDTFGGFVVGGNLVVGLVIFLILILIQFIVITKGASRISEVNARFTLDAMPGKQMAIDAELGAKAIDEDEARHRRQMLTREAEFYGAMDGAGKYVRGDAIAGLIITAINIVGGVVIGVMNGLTIAEALGRYSVLTVGDGLISQIPALIIATTAGLLVTKATSEESLGHEIGSQMLANDRPLWIGAIILLVISFTPGLPKTPFFLLAICLGAFARNMKPPGDTEPDPDETPESPEDREGQHIDEFIDTDRISLEVGGRLIPLVESNRTPGLRERIAGMRRDLTRKHGIWVPTIRIRDNVQLDAETYVVRIGGREVARGEIRVDQWLAVDPGGTSLQLDGEDTLEPVFGLPAKWISTNWRHRAELGGYTVVDAPNAVITHLGQIIRRYAHELLGREDLQKMLEKIRDTAPTVVDDLKPELVRMGVVHQVLVELLREHVPITNLPIILESIVNHAAQFKTPAELVEHVRVDLARSICDRFRNDEGRVRVIVLDPRLEMALREQLQEDTLSLLPAQLEKLMSVLGEEFQKARLSGHDIALLVDSKLRRPMRRSVDRALPDLAVVAYTEIPTDILIDPVRMLRRDDVFESNGPPQGDSVGTAAEQLEQALADTSAA